MDLRSDTGAEVAVNTGDTECTPLHISTYDGCYQTTGRSVSRYRFFPVKTNGINDQVRFSGASGGGQATPQLNVRTKYKR